jgi:hypothetical protein
MYLELSRPRGEVSRWTKVYERLALLNEFVPVKSCKLKSNPFHGSMNSDQTKFTLNYIINHKRIFAGADLLHFYEKSLSSKHTNTTWILRNKKPIVFFSNDSENDAKQLRNEFNLLRTYNPSEKSIPYTIKTLSSKGVDILPSMKVVCQGTHALVFIIDQTACHSYFHISISDGKILRIASMDSLITLYFSLGLIETTFFDIGSMECLANHLVEISIKARNHPENFAFPFISIQCVGHQTTLPSLIRAKVKRLTNKRNELKNVLKRNSSSMKTKTIKKGSKSIRRID